MVCSFLNKHGNGTTTLQSLLYLCLVRFDPKLSCVFMRDISSMFGGHIKSKTIINMMKKDGTMAKNDTDNGEVF